MRSQDKQDAEGDDGLAELSSKQMKKILDAEVRVLVFNLLHV